MIVKMEQEAYDVVVCGGGLAGVCAAVAAARQGASVCIIQDRPVLGGNSSSEIRVTPHGAAQFHAYARETGIISELLIEERALNHEPILENGWTNSVWDMVLYNMAVSTPNLTLHLNSTVTGVHKHAERHISSVTVRVAGAETQITAEGQVFIDCTGDGVVADLAGCEWRWGSEGREEFSEPHAPLAASGDTMGSSIHFKAKDMGRPVPFEAPDWAVRYEDPAFFYDQGRHFYDLAAGYWWIEIGIPWNTIYNNEQIRHELTRHVLGIWDWIKNRDPLLKEKAANYALDWIGQVPGKRESRRVLGRYFMTEHDPAGRTVFPDEIAFGGWFIDLHSTGGLLAPTAEPSAAEGYAETSEYAIKSYCGPYGIPLRILMAKDADNLLLAGRNVSVSHAALGTVRVMATTALLGQAAGTAASVALRRGREACSLEEADIREVQQILLREGCFLPNCRNEDPGDVARSARARAGSSARVHGVGPESRDYTGGFGGTRLPEKEPLTHRRGQWIAVGTEEIRSLAVCLSNESGTEQTVEASLVPVDSIWDYGCGGKQPLARQRLAVPPGRMQWVAWEAGLTAAEGLRSGGYVRLELAANPQVEWHKGGTVIPGHTSAYEMAPSTMRRYGDGGTLSFRIDPPQACYEPSNVLTGIARPYDYTNLWRSDPAGPLPQRLELEWETEQCIGTVELAFPGQLFREYHRYPPFYRDPQCPRDYSIAAWTGGLWTTVASVTGNYQTRRRHPLSEAVKTDKLRVTVHATNGDPSACIAEIRCYRF
ncbi:FAD-dependent oxidoreductase [Paenibacillus jilunlii]